MSDLDEVKIAEVVPEKPKPPAERQYWSSGHQLGDLKFGSRGEVIFPSQLADDAEDENDPDEDDTLPVVKIDARLPNEEIDVVTTKFVLDSIIDFLEELVLTGEQLRHAGQLLKDIEALRDTL